mgnify:CR=1 FL=1
MKTAEELFDELPAEPGPGKLNWIEYRHASVAMLVAWQNEILEAALGAAASHHDGLDLALRALKEQPPVFSFGDDR